MAKQKYVNRRPKRISAMRCSLGFPLVAISLAVVFGLQATFCECRGLLQLRGMYLFFLDVVCLLTSFRPLDPLLAAPTLSVIDIMTSYVVSMVQRSSCQVGVHGVWSPRRLVAVFLRFTNELATRHALGVRYVPDVSLSAR